MTNPTQSEPVALAAAIGILVNAAVVIVGIRLGLSEYEVGLITAGVTALATAWARRRVWSPVNHHAAVAASKVTKKAAKKR